LATKFTLVLQTARVRYWPEAKMADLVSETEKRMPGDVCFRPKADIGSFRE
jgi:hypothetical protein